MVYNEWKEQTAAYGMVYRAKVLTFLKWHGLHCVQSFCDPVLSDFKLQSGSTKVPSDNFYCCVIGRHNMLIRCKTAQNYHLEMLQLMSCLKIHAYSTWYIITCLLHLMAPMYSGLNVYKRPPHKDAQVNVPMIDWHGKESTEGSLSLYRLIYILNIKFQVWQSDKNTVFHVMQTTWMVTSVGSDNQFVLVQYISLFKSTRVATAKAFIISLKRASFTFTGWYKITIAL